MLAQPSILINRISLEEQLFNQYILYINGAINYLLLSSDLKDHDQTNYSPSITNPSLTSKFYQYIKILIFHHSLPLIQYKFALNLFYELISDINQYVMSVIQSKLKNHDDAYAFHKILIYKVLSQSFGFILKMNVYNDKDNDNSNVISLQIPLFYNDDLIKIDSKFKKLIYSFYDQSMQSPNDNLTKITTYFKVSYHHRIYKGYSILNIGTFSILQRNSKNKLKF